jgi:hypothetical protein
MKPLHRWLLAIGGCAWIVAVGLGFTLLTRYSTEAGAAALAPASWPSESRLPAPQGRYQLVMSVHPHCPCSRASVIELNNLMALLRRDNVKAYVLVVKPSEFPDAWIETESVRDARRIPGVDVLMDVDGVESEHLGAQTSGQTLLYGPDGELLFAGGLTADRRHVGDSPGRQRIVSLVKHGTADAKESLVFGCSLGASVCQRPSHAHPRGL